MLHVDDWLDNHTPQYEGERYAKEVLEHRRRPAIDVDYEWLRNHPLFCNYEGERWKCNGASRMGDVWLTKQFSEDMGYEKRVDVAQCSAWGSSEIEPLINSTDVETVTKALSELKSMTSDEEVLQELGLAEDQIKSLVRSLDYSLLLDHPQFMSEEQLQAWAAYIEPERFLYSAAGIEWSVEGQTISQVLPESTILSARDRLDVIIQLQEKYNARIESVDEISRYLA